MRSNGYGRIVNISSGTPFKGTPNLLHYVTSKGAILALTRALAREVGGDGICVNTLAPGLVLSEGVIQNTDMRDKLTGPVIASRAIKRDQTPEDLIEPLLFLASDDCAFMTGETLVVDGGSVMH
jgi:NAD(P)-dependent dehydrogenase (short-subunit alcohol dehydrogenase family)